MADRAAPPSPPRSGRDIRRAIIEGNRRRRVERAAGRRHDGHGGCHGHGHSHGRGKEDDDAGDGKKGVWRSETVVLLHVALSLMFASLPASNGEMVGCLAVVAVNVGMYLSLDIGSSWGDCISLVCVNLVLVIMGFERVLLLPSAMPWTSWVLFVLINGALAHGYWLVVTARDKEEEDEEEEDDLDIDPTKDEEGKSDWRTNVFFLYMVVINVLVGLWLGVLRTSDVLAYLDRLRRLVFTFRLS